MIAGRQLVVAAITVCFGTTAAGARDKTDVITLVNGDRIHGEIVQLQYGVLQLKTDSMGTVSIEWPDIVSVHSTYIFVVEQVGGLRHFGTLETPPDGRQLTVLDIHQAEPVTMANYEVTRISQVESTFWQRIDGSFSVGLNYTQSSDVGTASIRFEAGYRAETMSTSFTTDYNTTQTPEEGTQDRLRIAFDYHFLRPNAKFWAGNTSFERNEELGIDGRLQLGAGIGRSVLQRPSSEIVGYLGLAVNQEWVSGDADAQQTGEGVLGGQWRIFRFSDPETSLTSRVALYPTLTEGDRYRAQLDLSLRREIVKDLFLDLSFYDSFDSEPPSEDADTNDYGIVTSLGYRF
jgi:hypothetical protein